MLNCNINSMLLILERKGSLFAADSIFFGAIVLKVYLRFSFCRETKKINVEKIENSLGNVLENSF